MFSFYFSAERFTLTLSCFFSFAFVEFESADDAKDALENLNHTEIEGRSVRLEFSQNSGGRDGGRGNSGMYSPLKLSLLPFFSTRYDENLIS